MQQSHAWILFISNFLCFTWILFERDFLCFAGMGDVLTLVEKAEESIKADEADEMTKRIMQQKFDFNDFLKQTQMMSSMGGMGNLTKMLPGLHTWT